MHKLKILPLLLMVGLVGCTTGGITYGNKMSAADVNSIVKGKTTEAELLARFGRPISKYPSVNGQSLMSFTYTDTFGYIAPQSYIPIVGAFTGRADISKQTQTLVVVLSPEGVVNDYTFSDDTSTTVMKKHGLGRASITTK